MAQNVPSAARERTLRAHPARAERAAAERRGADDEAVMGSAAPGPRALRAHPARAERAAAERRDGCDAALPAATTLPTKPGMKRKTRPSAEPRDADLESEPQTERGAAVVPTPNKSQKCRASAADRSNITHTDEKRRLDHNNEVKATKQAAHKARAVALRSHSAVLKRFGARVPSLPRSFEPADTAASEATQPAQILVEMRDYQVAGLQWLVRMHHSGLNAILADEMGLGKTMQTISFLAHLKFCLGVQGPYLVVCPLSVLSSWMTELRRFCPELRAIKLHSADAEERKRLMTALAEGPVTDMADVVVTTYEMAKSPNVTPVLAQRIWWRYLIVDEGHVLKNDSSQVSQALRRYHFAHALLLTGTPLQNNLRELWALLNFLYPDVFTSSSAFDAAFQLGSGSNGSSRVDAAMLNDASTLLRPLMLRRTKDEVEKTLPPALETRIDCPLSEMQLFWYKRLLLRESALLKQLEQEHVERAAAGGTDWKRLSSLLMQLRKCCNHPFLFPGVAPSSDEEYDAQLVEGSGKFQLLQRLLAKLHGAGRRVVLFSQFTSTLDLLEDFLALEGYKYCRLDGSTNRVQRTVDINAFNMEGSSRFCFLMSTRAGGLGINCQTADTCILFDSDWNPQVDLQAMARVHRIGQTQTVHLYRLVSSGTVEERIVQRAEKKLYLDKMVNRNSSTQQVDIEQPSASDMAGLLRFGARCCFSAAEPPNDEQLDAIIDRSRREGDDLGGLVRRTAEFDAPAVGLQGASQDGSGVRTGRHESHTGEAAVLPSTSHSVSQLEELLGSAGSRKASTMTDISAEWQSLQSSKRLCKARFTTVQVAGVGEVAILNDNNYAMGGEMPNAAHERGTSAMAFRQTGRQVAGRDFKHEELCLCCWQPASQEDKEDLNLAGDTLVESKGSDDADNADGSAQHASRDAAVRDTQEPAEQTASGEATNCPESSGGGEAGSNVTGEQTTSGTAEPVSESTDQADVQSISAGRGGCGPLRGCDFCPAAFHLECLGLSKQAMRSMSVWACPHHSCMTCGRKAAAAGGMLFRCTVCPHAYCEDHLPAKALIMGECERFQALGCEHSRQGCYILCQLECIQRSADLGFGCGDAAASAAAVLGATGIDSTATTHRPAIKSLQPVRDERTSWQKLDSMVAVALERLLRTPVTTLGLASAGLRARALNLSQADASTNELLHDLIYDTDMWACKASSKDGESSMADAIARLADWKGAVPERSAARLPENGEGSLPWLVGAGYESPNDEEKDAAASRFLTIVRQLEGLKSYQLERLCALLNTQRVLLEAKRGMPPSLILKPLKASGASNKQLVCNLIAMGLTVPVEEAFLADMRASDSATSVEDAGGRVSTACTVKGAFLVNSLPLFSPSGRHLEIKFGHVREVREKPPPLPSPVPKITTAARPKMARSPPALSGNPTASNACPPVAAAFPVHPMYNADEDHVLHRQPWQLPNLHGQPMVSNIPYANAVAPRPCHRSGQHYEWGGGSMALTQPYMHEQAHRELIPRVLIPQAGTHSANAYAASSSSLGATVSSIATVSNILPSSDVCNGPTPSPLAQSTDTALDTISDKDSVGSIDDLIMWEGTEADMRQSQPN